MTTVDDVEKDTRERTTTRITNSVFRPSPTGLDRVMAEYSRSLSWLNPSDASVTSVRKNFFLCVRPSAAVWRISPVDTPMVCLVPTAHLADERMLSYVPETSKARWRAWDFAGLVLCRSWHCPMSLFEVVSVVDLIVTLHDSFPRRNTFSTDSIGRSSDWTVWSRMHPRYCNDETSLEWCIDGKIPNHAAKNKWKI